MGVGCRPDDHLVSTRRSGFLAPRPTQTTTNHHQATKLEAYFLEKLNLGDRDLRNEI